MDKADEIKALAHECRKAAVFYEEKPGLFGPSAAIDLYRTIARLCDLISALPPVGGTDG